MTKRKILLDELLDTLIDPYEGGFTCGVLIIYVAEDGTEKEIFENIDEDAVVEFPWLTLPIRNLTIVDGELVIYITD